MSPLHRFCQEWLSCTVPSLVKSRRVHPLVRLRAQHVAIAPVVSASARADQIKTRGERRGWLLGAVALGFRWPNGKRTGWCDRPRPRCDAPFLLLLVTRVYCEMGVNTWNEMYNINHLLVYVYVFLPLKLRELSSIPKPEP
jgi:hypothetical protein